MNSNAGMTENAKVKERPPPVALSRMKGWARESLIHMVIYKRTDISVTA